MKKYRNYTAKKFRLPRRIIFFTVIALLIVVFTVIIGNILKARLEGAEIDTSEVLTTTAPEENKVENDDKGEQSREHEEALLAVRAGYLDLSGITDAAAARSAVEGLKEAGYNALSFAVTDKSGAITYASPAVIEASRLPASEKLVPFEVLSAAVNAAKGSGVRVSGVISVSESRSDALVMGELSALGFEELIIRGFEDVTEPDNNAVETIRAYVEKLRDAAPAGISIGVAFDTEFFVSAKNAPYIEKLYKYMEFMAIDLSERSAEEIKNVAEELQGSFSAYLLRPLLSGADEKVKGEADAFLKEAQIAARQYISIPEKQETDGDDR